MVTLLSDQDLHNSKPPEGWGLSYYQHSNGITFFEDCYQPLDIHFTSDSHVLTANTTFKINVTSLQPQSVYQIAEYVNLMLCFSVSLPVNVCQHSDGMDPTLLSRDLCPPTPESQNAWGERSCIGFDLMAHDFQFPVLLRGNRA